MVKLQRDGQYKTRLAAFQVSVGLIEDVSIGYSDLGDRRRTHTDQLYERADCVRSRGAEDVRMAPEQERTDIIVGKSHLSIQHRPCER